MKCPRCRTLLSLVYGQSGVPKSADEPQVDGDLQLERCPSCRGIYFDRGELSQLTGVSVQSYGRGEILGPAFREKCPDCGALRSKEEITCEYCDGSLAMHCPKCHNPFTRLKIASVPIEYCDKCRRVWLDPTEATALAAAIGTGEAGDLVCVRCGKQHLTPGRSMVSSQGTICEKCHFDIDAGEPEILHPTNPLTEILGFILGADTKPSPRIRPTPTKQGRTIVDEVANGLFDSVFKIINKF